MITLATGGTLKGKAGTASAITYTISGDAVTTTDAFQILGQGVLAGTTGDLLTTTPVPSSTVYLIKEIALANTTGSNVTGVIFYVNGTAAGNQLDGGISIAAGGSATYNDDGWRVYDANGVVQSVGSIGPTGSTGAAATIAVGTTSNTAPGTTATVGNSGSSSAATFNFTIPAGSVWYSGTAAPSTLHNNGDYYLRTSTGDVYEQVSGAWGSPIENLVGPTGTAGVVQAVIAADTSITIGGTTPNPTVSRGALTGDVTSSGGSQATTVTKINSTALSGLATGILKNTTTTGVPSIAAAGTDYVAPTGSGAGLTGVVTSVTGTAPIASSGGQTPAVSITAATISAAGSMSANDKKKLNLHIYDVVADYGADPTGTTNSATAIQNAVNAAQTAAYTGNSGGIVWFPPGRYLIGSTIVVTGSNITLWGAGGGASADFGNYAVPMASHLVPQSAIKAVQVIPVQTNGVSGVPNFGFKWKGLGIDNYANAGTMGLQLISCANFDIDDFYAINSTSVGLDMNCLPGAVLTVAAVFPLSAATLTVNTTAASGTGSAFPANTNTAGSVCLADGTGVARLITYTGGSATTFTGCSSAGAGTGTAAIGGFVRILPGAQDCTRGRFGLLNFRQVDAGGASGIAIQLNGDAGGTANTCLNNFVGPVKISHINADGIKDINSDTNFYDTVVINRVSGGTGLGAEIGAGTTAAAASRNNVFNHCSFGAGGLTCRGTPTATFASGPTRVMNYQLANGEALPTIETGANLYWDGNGLIREGRLNSSVASQLLTAATATVITGTSFAVPPQGWQVGTRLKWRCPLIKTAVGTSWSATIRQNTALTAGTGTAIATVTYTGTGAIDGGVFEAELVCTNITTPSAAVALATFELRHDLAATGLGTGVTVPAGDVTAPAGYVYTRPTMATFAANSPNSATTFVWLELNAITASTVMTVEAPASVSCLASIQN